MLSSTRPSLRSVTVGAMLLAVGVTAALAYVLYLGAQTQSRSHARVELHVAQIARYEDAQVAFANLGSSLSTYYALRGPSNAEAFALAHAQGAESLDAALAAAPQLGDAETIRSRALLSSYTSVADSEVRLLKALEQNDVPAAFAITGETSVIDASYKLTLDLREAVSSERHMLGLGQDAESAARRHTFEYALGLAGTWAVLLLLLGLASLRWLVRPLERVSVATLRIADGDLTERIAEKGPRELAQVGADVNRMTEALRRRSAELSAYLSRNLEARTTELETSNAALSASEERFRALVQNASDMITIVDATGRAMYASPSFERIMGYSPEEWSAIKVLDIIHPDDRARAAASLVRVATEPGVRPEIELRVRHRDGSYRYLDMVATNLVDDPAVRGIVHNSRDVTERRAMESALRDSEARFRSLAEHSPVGIYQLSSDRRPLYLNRAALAILGADDLASVEKVPFDRFFTAQSLLVMRREHPKRGLGVASTYEVEAVAMDGTRRNLLVSGAPVRGADGEAMSSVGTMMDITERKRAEDALRKNEEKFRLLFASNPHPMWVYDLETLVFLEVNDAAVTNYGYTRGQFLAMRITDIRPEEDNERLLRIVKTHSPLQQSGEWRHRTADGRVIDVEITSDPFQFESRDAVLVVAMDITERNRVQQALEESEERFRSLVQNASDLITVIRPDTTVLYQSPSIEGTLGYKPGDLIGLKFSSFVHPSDYASLITFLSQATARRDSAAVCEARVRHQDGTWRTFEITGSDCTRDPAVGGFVLNTRDVSERKMLEQQLRDQAFQDTLTGLANRARFTERLDHALERTADKSPNLGVLFVDLDNFKAVNDSLGHAAGDRVLFEAAQRLRSCLRAGDTAARFGGDEFAVLVENTTFEEVVSLSNRIVEELGRPVDVDGRQVNIGASVGVAWANEDREQDLVHNADVAMYVAKTCGKARSEVYDPSMHEAIAKRLELVADLQRAMEANEFFLEYQPTFRLQTLELSGVEALVRWQHPTRGLIMPAEFIAHAEESGLISSLGHWILITACHQAKEWSVLHGAAKLTMNVNVSVRQLQQSTFVDEVAAVLRESGVDPANIVLEVTESVMMQDVEATLPVLNNLKRLGVRLAIDDFGTGYSSLSYLARYPFDILKIDKSFVDGIDREGSQLELTRAMIDVARTLHLEVVAEGIEREEQAAELRRLRCDLVQGFLFARPLSALAIDAMLEGRSPALAA